MHALSFTHWNFQIIRVMWLLEWTETVTMKTAVMRQKIKVNTWWRGCSSPVLFKLINLGDLCHNLNWGSGRKTAKESNRIQRHEWKNTIVTTFVTCLKKVYLWSQFLNKCRFLVPFSHMVEFSFSFFFIKQVLVNLVISAIHSSVETIFVFRITGDVTAKTIVETGAMVLAKDNLEPVARSIVNANRG